jgi:uncharacterized membrane protein YccC
MDRIDEPSRPWDTWFATNRLVCCPAGCGCATVRRSAAALWAAALGFSLSCPLRLWLELDNPFWAGTTAAIVCQPHLGASLRKGWYRMIGSLAGAVVIVVLTAWFPQDPLS